MRTHSPKNCRHESLLTALVSILLAACLGCGPGPYRIVEAKPRERTGKVFYLDGAGGGGSLVNWGRDLIDTLRKSSKSLTVTNFSWQIGLGAVLDQQASVEYKREQAAKLASQIREYRRKEPLGEVYLVGLSAGSVVVLYALEQLPEDCQVDGVILLASSVCASYDLSQALARTRGKMYVFTSSKDAVLNGLVPLTGTADRKYCGLDIAGLRGFRMPEGLAEDAQREYRKVVTIRWKPEYERLGHNGGHTDCVKASFVQVEVAPLLTTPPRALAQGEIDVSTTNEHHEVP